MIGIICYRGEMSELKPVNDDEMVYFRECLRSF